MTRDETIKRWEEEGRSKHEITYFLADKQKDYEPLLKDPETPERIISDIVDRITLFPLKILAFNHPNISARSQRYMLDKADKKDYQRELVEAFLTNEKDLDEKNWIQIRKFYNKAERFDICVMELIEAQNDIFTTQKLDIILNVLAMRGPGKEKSFERYLLAIFDHKNFDIKILDGYLFGKDTVKPDYPEVVKAVLKSKNKDIIFGKFYEMTEDQYWLPQEAKDIFLF